MPELPEVESTRLSLEPALLGRSVTRARLRRPDMCSRPDGKPCTARDLLQGATIAEMIRHGKQLALVARDGRVLIVQLGMTGSLRARPANAPGPDKHIHALWTLDSGAAVAFRDPRRFGALRAFGSLDEVRATAWADLGPDAASITGKGLHAGAHRSRRAIKAALLDQGVLAGVGNIYADEALFGAGIRPARLASRVTRAEYDRLARCIRRTLMLAVRAGGSTIRDYLDGAGRRGRAQDRHAVYGRAGKPCVACGTGLKGRRLAQRATVYCPKCQK